MNPTTPTDENVEPITTDGPSINIEIIVTLPDGTKKSENWEYEDLIGNDRVFPQDMIADVMQDIGDWLDEGVVFDDVELDDESDDDDAEDDEDEDGDIPGTGEDVSDPNDDQTDTQAERGVSPTIRPLSGDELPE